MADETHLKILMQGVEAWNRWREENPGVRPDLSGADLGGARLSGADLKGANLMGANLSGVNLGGVDLSVAIVGPNLS